MRNKLSIKNIKYVTDYVLKIEFNDGKVKNVDFEGFLSTSDHPEISKYLKKSLFKKFKIEHGDLMWGDFDLIFPIADLYKNKVIRNKASRSDVA